MVKMVSMGITRQAILAFPPVKLAAGEERQLFTFPAPTDFHRVHLLRFINARSLDNLLLVKASISERARTFEEFVSVGLFNQLELSETVDPRTPLPLMFRATVDLTIDCGFVVKVPYQI